MIRKKESLRFLLALLPVSIVMLAFVFKGSYSLFSSQHDVINNLGTNYGVSVQENFNPPTNGWTTSSSVTKQVWVSNTGKTAALVRVHAAEFWKDKDGNLLSTALANPNNQNQLTDVVTKNWTSSWSNDWVLHDGWYYYKQVLKAGASTPQFLASVQLNTTLIGSDSQYTAPGTSYHLNFYQESVQADPGDAVKALWGFTPTVNADGSVAWGF